uniref:Uncharacterized protein n=1 Tax=Schlesneria paludicola TaxID=360056 RepID=A0A7C2P3I7_9PLAN
MRRGIIIGGLAVAVLTGCQSSYWSGSKQCADCTPPKSYCPIYKPLCDNLVTKQTAVFCADKALKDLQKECGKQSSDFKYGFRDAYVDLAMGRPALVPPVPPRRYWNAYYRSCAGEPQVADWFEGYRTGLTYGAQSGVSQFDRVATTWSAGAPDSALCGPPELVSPGPAPASPTPAPIPPASSAMGPYGPLLHPAGYQTPAYAAPANPPPLNPPPVQRIGRMQLDVF